MRVSYLLRFDDLSPWTRWESWNPIEDALLRLHIRPILAVVPDNRDPALTRRAPDPLFWERVRRWQASGWTIGLHGYQHVFLTRDSGLVGIHRRSEFTGLDPGEQGQRIDRALEIMAREGVSPRVWIAPAHSFDRNTLRVLLERGIGIVSDGFWRSPRVDEDGMIWIPQQLWRFRYCPGGLWTVCSHTDTWTVRQVEDFLESMRRYRSRIVDLSAGLKFHPPRSITWGDRRMASVFRFALGMKQAVRHQLGRGRRSGRGLLAW